MPTPDNPDQDDQLDYGDGKKLPRTPKDELEADTGESVEIPEEAFMGQGSDAGDPSQVTVPPRA